MSASTGPSSFPVSARLAQLGIVLPPVPAPVAAYVPARRVGGLVYVSGQLPTVDGALQYAGTVPGRVGLEDAVEAARICGLNALAAAAALVGGPDAIKGVVRVGCFVACEAGFADHPKVANGCSELYQSIFGDAGRHARAAVGSPSLPRNTPVEIEVIFEVE